MLQYALVFFILAVAAAAAAGFAGMTAGRVGMASALLVLWLTAPLPAFAANWQRRQ